MNIKYTKASQCDGSLEQIENIRDRLVNLAIVAASVVGLPLLIAALLRISVAGWHSSILIYILIYILMAATAICRGRLPFPVRGGILIGTALIVGIVDLVSWGLAAMGVPFILIFIVLTTVMFGSRYGIAAAAVGITTLVIIGVCILLGWIRFDFDANVYLATPSCWIAAILTAGLFAFIIVGILGRLYCAYTDSIKHLNRQTANFRDASQQLEQEIATRKDTEREYLRAEREKEAILNAMTDVSIEFIDTELKLIWVNERVLKLYGKTEDQIVGAPCYEVIRKRRSPCPECIALKALETGKIQQEEVPHSNGETYFVQSNPVRDEDGTIIGVVLADLNITQRKQMEIALQESEERYRSLHANVPVGVFRTSPDGRVISANPAAVKMLGYDLEKELLSKPVVDFYSNPEDRGAFIKQLQAEGRISDLEIQFRRKDNTRFWVAISATKIVNQKGDFNYIDGVVQDITARKQAENALSRAYDELEQKVKERTRELSETNTQLKAEVEERRRLNKQLEKSQQSLEASNDELEAAIFKANQMAADAEIRNYQLEEEIGRRMTTEKKLRISEEKYRSIIENIEEGYYEVDVHGNFQFVNDAICDILGFSRQSLLDMNSLSIFDEMDREGILQAFERVSQCDESISAYGFDVKMPDGSKRSMETSIALIKDAEGKKTGFRGIVRDVEQRKQYEEKLVYLAYHDALTGIGNRMAFYERLKEGLAYAKRYHTEIALVYIDIDRFKKVNDTLGHEIGDALLIEIAKRLRDCTRETDFVFRIGGDEFTIVLNNPKQVNHNVVAERIADSLSKPYIINEIEIDYISASIGISLYPQDAHDAETLIRNADAAMYQAKEDGDRHLRHTA